MRLNLFRVHNAPLPAAVWFEFARALGVDLSEPNLGLCCTSLRSCFYSRLALICARLGGPSLKQCPAPEPGPGYAKFRGVLAMDAAVIAVLCCAPDNSDPVQTGPSSLSG